MPFRLMSPVKIDAETRYPVIVSLHGGGGRGTDNMRQLRGWNQRLAEANRRAEYPCYVLALQTERHWDADHLAAIKEIIAKLPSVDRNRIYILGHSMGGHGTYSLLQLDPGYFAAAGSSAGTGLSTTDEFIDVSLIKDIPIWAFHGDQDPRCPYEGGLKLFTQMVKAGGNLKFTTWAGDKHGGPVAEKMITGSDNGRTLMSSERCDPEPEFMKWLFAQSLTYR
ncbi:prolyl oligopeptidase family serine peptidase [Puniceicoccales bacterium CK1056]|uniref:Prolyl oligopeptidase family serine peptidase n=1 Tax=Oceanipulchritudo coccoides TaxID=2706888 RepID=A0A6B2LX02_9BACT|nr:prolyl oligopeptidase family serine peptidase [Oceanipulchritudo coccoides]NDV60991.1 prolyl oligopeptidase family serine peptidase [Oceanipulchritudo coccoides]